MNENIRPQITIPTVPVDILRVGLNFFLNLKREFEVCYHENTKRSRTEVSSCYEMNNGNARSYTQLFHTSKMAAVSHSSSFSHNSDFWF